jgi:hypothetical protein
MVFIPSLKKWVMLDPDLNAYFMDSNGNLLSPWEAREKLATNGEITFNTDIDAKSSIYTKSGQSFQEKTDDYREYMAKNLFYISCSRINTFGNDLAENQEKLYLAPKGFDITERELANYQYRIENAPPQWIDFYKRALEKTKKDTNRKKLIISLEQFMGK